MRQKFFWKSLTNRIKCDIMQIVEQSLNYRKGDNKWKTSQSVHVK